MNENESTSKETKRKDILEPGTVYKELEIVSLVESSVEGNYPSRYIYKCRCINCGEMVEIRRDHIMKYGRSSKCRCRLSRTKKREIDTTSLIGQRFNDLIVVRFAKHEKGQNSYWYCRCARCGNIIEVRENNLKNGNSTMCRSCSDRLAGEKRRINPLSNNIINHPVVTDAISFIDKNTAETPKTIKPFFRVIKEDNK